MKTLLPCTEHHRCSITMEPGITTHYPEASISQAVLAASTEPAPAPKPSFEERARAAWDYCAQREDWCARLAAAFAEVEMEAFKRGFNSAIASQDKPGDFISEAKSGTAMRAYDDDEPCPIGLGVIHFRAGLVDWSKVDLGPAPACVCGAAATRTLPHSPWCDAQ
jgi:hypothetical protein